jgi:TP901 family phage tail tape measure protein
MDKLNIIVQAILNKQANISSINEQLKEIQSKIDKLKINIDFDEKILKTLKDFSTSIQKINDLIKYQNEVIRQNTIITKEADGSTKKIEQSQLRSGEIIEKTTQIIDKNTQAIQKNIQEQQKLAQIREKYKEGSLTGITEIAKSDYHTTITNYNADKTQELTRIEIENIEKRVKAEQKAQDEISKALLKTEQNRRKEIEKSTEAQAKAINKSLELEYKAQQAEELRIQRLGALREKVSSELFEGDYDAVRNNLQKFLENFYGVNAKVVELKRNFTSAGKEVWNFTTNVKTGKDTFEQYKGSIDRTTQALYDFGPSVEKTLSRNLSIFEQFKIALARIPIWIAGMTAFYQTLRFFTNGVAYVNELNKALTEISMVTNKNQAEVAKLGKEYQKLALDMAVSTKQIAEASVTFYRQGLNQAEVMDRVKYATMGAKVAGLDFAQTAELLTATTNGMNVSIQRASDTFSYLGDATATSYDEIAKGFQKVSGTAGAMNLEFEKVASYIATVSAKTRESAESIGTSFKTIFARMSQLTEQGFNEEDETRINDVAIALAQVGIELTKNDGSFRNFGDVLDELGAKWNTLDSRTKAYLATTLAGKILLPSMVTC